MRATRSFVRAYLERTIEHGQASIAEYASRYTNTMIGALATCMQGNVPPLQTSRSTDLCGTVLPPAVAASQGGLEGGRRGGRVSGRC